MAARSSEGVGGLPWSIGVAGAPAGDGDAGDAGRWQVHRLHGPASTLHRRPWPDRADPAVWFLSVDRPALVLGSTQAGAIVDRDRTHAAGVEIVRRRSGGGAVLLWPEAVTWVDVFVPAADPLWSDDVARAFWWLGQAWVEALAAAGVTGAQWHQGPLVRTRWSDLVCFAGLGPGEVTLHGRKVVGMSQRRTRSGALLQCAALREWDPEGVAALLQLDSPEARSELAHAGSGLAVEGAALQEAFLSAVARR